MKIISAFLLLVLFFLACGKLADQSGVIDREQMQNITLWTVLWQPYDPDNTSKQVEGGFNPHPIQKATRAEQDLIGQVDMYLNAKYRITTVEPQRAKGILAISMPNESGMYRPDAADVIVNVMNKDSVTLAVLKVFEDKDEARLKRKGISVENLGDLTAYMIFETMTNIGY